MTAILQSLSYRSFRVWQRNRDVYLATWKTNFVPPLVEPILYLLAFGAGVGALVKQVTYSGQELSYIQFIAPGLIATQAMFQPFFENTYSTYIRIFYQKTFDAILSTPLTLEDIMAGEILWGATQGLIACTLMTIAISFFGLLEFPAALWILPTAFLAGILFASVGVAFSATVPTIGAFNFPTFLFIMPMFLFSGTFFPLDLLPVWAQKVAYVLPLTHVVILMRHAALGRIGPELVWHFGYLAFTALPMALLAIYLMRRKLVK